MKSTMDALTDMVRESLVGAGLTAMILAVILGCVGSGFSVAAGVFAIAAFVGAATFKYLYQK